MTTFFIDLWQDLREKRLWPVAVGLLAACVAVPVLLFKPAAAPPPQPPLPTATAGPRLPVVSVSSSPSEGSKLLAFSERNPFRPLADLQSSSNGGGSSSGSNASTGNSPSASPSSGSNPLSSLLHPASPSGSGSTPSTSSSTSPSTVPSLVPPSTTHTIKWFRWAADFKFGTNGQLDTKTDLQTLTLLPSNQQPVITYMGATNGGSSVVIFIADPTYTASGQGQCNVSGYACRFVTLTPSASSETFTSADGNTKFKIQLVRIYKKYFTPKNSTDQSVVHAAANDKIATLDVQQLVPALLSLVGGGQVVGSDATP